MSTALNLDGESLTVEDLVRVARDRRARVAMDPDAVERVRRGRRQIDGIVERYRVEYAAWDAGESGDKLPQDYGVTTGFGEFKRIPVPPEDLEELQRNLLLSHSVGVGENADADDLTNYFPAEVVRGALLIRVNAFLKGHSGVRVELCETLVDLLHAGVVPLVPVKGSLGASGDLCPLAHLFAVLLGEGRYYVAGRPRTLKPAAELASELAGEPLKPSFKEGLALSNGANFSATLLALAVHDGEILTATADVAGALTLEAICGCARAFDPRVHAARGQPGQVASAANVRAMVEGSKLVDAAAAAVQDPYSVRCAPVVHGATRDAVAFARGVVERELNAATDNPLFFPEDGEPWDWRFAGNWPASYDGRERLSYSAGNFHGQPLGLAADFLAIALAELANISERRTQLLLDAHHNRNLPANLVARRGVNSGLMLAQYTSASLVTENKILAHPASVDSIPTGANSEDHVAMSATAGQKLRTVAGNVQAALGIELMVAAQAVEWRAGMGYRPSVGRPPRLGRSPVVAAYEGRERVDEEAREFTRRTSAQNRPRIASRLGPGTAAAYLAIREAVETIHDDRPLDGDLRRMRTLVAGGGLLERVESELGRRLGR